MSSRFAIDKTLTVDDLRFHYRDWGGRGWPILLLHGLSSTSHIWDLVAPLLSEVARVVALDLRGHGQSDKPDSDYSFETVGGDVFDVIVQLEMDYPVIVGHGWGANIGLWIAARDPDALSGLVMLDGGVMDLGGMSWEETLERMNLPAVGGTPVGQFRANLRERAPQGLMTPAVEAAILSKYEVDDDNLIRRRLPRDYHVRILRSLWETRLEPLYEQVACPVLVLPCRRSRGDEPDDTLRRKEAGVSRAARLRADVEVRWLENTVHDAPLQRPHRVAEEIIRFISERI